MAATWRSPEAVVLTHTLSKRYPNLSIFSPNLDAFSSKVFVAPKDEYEVEIASWKVAKITTKNQTTMYIVNCNTRIISNADGDMEFANKPLQLGFMLNEGNEDDFKRLLMFAMNAKGIKPGTDEADAAFREQYGSLNWGIDTEALTVGDGYETLQKARVIVNVDVRASGDKQYTDYKGSRSI